MPNSLSRFLAVAMAVSAVVVVPRVRAEAGEYYYNDPVFPKNTGLIIVT